MGNSAERTVLSAGIDFGLGKVGSRTQWSRTKRMMQRRHQWEVADLRAAGLNPILSAGAAPSMGSPQQQKTPDIARHRDVGRQVRQDRATRNQFRNQRALMSAQVGALNAQTGLHQGNTAKALAETEFTRRKSALIRPGSTIMDTAGNWLDRAAAGIQGGNSHRSRRLGPKERARRDAIKKFEADQRLMEFLSHKGNSDL